MNLKQAIIKTMTRDDLREVADVHEIDSVEMEERLYSIS